VKTVLPYGRKGPKKGSRAKRSGAALRGDPSETQLAIGAFEQSAIGTALIELNGNWIQVNSALCRILGYSEPELLAKTFQSITHPEDLGPELNCISQVLKGEIRSFQMEKRYVHKADHIVPALLTVSLMFDSKDKPHFLCCQVQDISERKQAEEKLRGSEELLPPPRGTFAGRHIGAAPGHDHLCECRLQRIVGRFVSRRTAGQAGASIRTPR
jgi:PAS domain S-box-containing protein